MKTFSCLASFALLSMAVACGGASEPSNGNDGEQSSSVNGSPQDPPPAPAPAPAPAPTPAPAPGCTPLPKPSGSVNPAAVYCTSLGYTLSGEQCQFPDGTACEEWAFYRGECGQAHSFCNLHGGSVANKTEDMGGWTASYALCTMPDGTHCHDDAFAVSCTCE